VLTGAGLPPDTDLSNVISKIKAAGLGLPRVTDGEQGERTNFTAFQWKLIGQVHPLVAQPFPPIDYKELTEEDKSYIQSPGFAKFDTKYDEYALQGWEIFQKLQKSGIIEPETKFQVCIPTPANVVGPFTKAAFQPAFHPVYMQGLKDAITSVANKIENSRLAIQIDVALELAYLCGISGYMPNEPGYLNIHDPENALEVIATDIVELVKTVPQTVDVGLHFCWGNLGNQRFITPGDSAQIARLGRVLLDRISRPLAWIHFPIPAVCEVKPYLAPLKADVLPKLKVNRTEFFVGAIYPPDATKSLEHWKEAKAELEGYKVGISTECGLGRSKAEDLQNFFGVLEKIGQSQ
jgi:hypothetical protein